MKRSNKKTTAAPRGSSRWTVLRVVLVVSGMVLMFLLESLFWPGRGLAWQRAVFGGPAAGAAPASTVVPPWGQLEYTPLALDRPEEYFTNDLPSGVKSVWVFHNHTEQQLVSFLGSLDLADSTRAYLTNRTHWEFKPPTIRISPPPDIVVSLSRETRRRLYEMLAHNPENVSQATPFRFRVDGFDSWFAECGLPQAKIDLVRNLTYQQQSNLCFADVAAFAQLSTSEETRCLVKSLWRVPTFIMKVKVDPQIDIDALVKYWGIFGSGRAYKPLLESMSRVPESGSLNVSYFLPPFARLRLYTYPDPRDSAIVREDCFWTAMNFFNRAPDNGFFNPEHTRAVLKTDYARLGKGPRRFGDVLLLLSRDSQALHMCIYLADDVVFTKNGANTQQPWVLMKLPEMLGEYETSKPFEIVTYRRKTPPPASSLDFSAARSAP